MDGQRARRIRKSISCLAISVYFSLQGKLLLSTALRGSTLVDVGDAPGGNVYINNILEETVELLFMGNRTAAHDYLQEHPLDSFKFYVHDELAETVDSISECLEDWGYHSERFAYTNKEQFVAEICDWSKSICNPTNHTRASQYSTARLNNNIDSVLARLFLDYHGRFRTFNATARGSLKVVPFPAVSNERCNMHWRRGREDPSTELLLGNNWTHLHDHLFLFMNAKSDMAKLSVDKVPSKRTGQLVVPYVNTNAEYQPNKVASRMTQRFFSGKKYALAAVFSEKISGNGYARKEFVEKADSFFGNGTIAHNNGTLGDLPVRVIVIQEKRKDRESLTPKFIRGHGAPLVLIGRKWDWTTANS
ncbi:hypothetical protein ACHAXT_000889 [Thalassiosira profunda]